MKMKIKAKNKITGMFAATVDGLTPRVNRKYWFLSTGFANVTSTIEPSISRPFFFIKNIKEKGQINKIKKI